MKTFKTMEDFIVEGLTPYIKGEKDFGYDHFEDYCVYHGNDGQQCMYGQYIRDEDYRYDFEHEGVVELIHRDVPFDFKILSNPSIEDDKNLHAGIQHLHDSLCSDTLSIRRIKILDNIAKEGVNLSQEFIDLCLNYKSKP